MIDCVQYTYADRNLSARRYVLDPSAADPFGGERPVVYALLSGELDGALGTLEGIVDRGTKDERKELSRDLLGQEGIPALRASYSSTGRFFQSVQVLLERAVQRGEERVYLIGIDEQLLGGLLAAVDAVQEPAYIPDTPTGQLLKLLPPLPIPAELRAAYIGRSPQVELVRQLIVRAVPRREPVLVIGETGTGKELVSRAVHELGLKQDEPFIAVNCGAIPSRLFESELFGHVRGSFTGAAKDKPGLWEVAGEGTLFLDEIGDLAEEHQVKVLRTLQEGVIRRVGDTKDRPVAARVVAATNRDLFSQVQSGQFREDLYYRLRAFMIQTPALRDQPDDIPLIAQHFWRRIAADERAVLPGDIVAEIKTYRWPGNSRELRMVLVNMFSLFGSENLDVEHLRAVYQLQGDGVQAWQDIESAGEIGMHKVECLHHLRRVDEVLRAVKVSIRPLLREGERNRERIGEMQEIVQQHAAEIEVLCLHPLRFNTQEMFNRISKLNASLKEFSRLLKGSAAKAKQYWQDEVAEFYKDSQGMIFAEVESLVSRG